MLIHYSELIIEAQGLLEVESSSILDLVSSNQLLSYPMLCHSFKGCALPPSLMFHYQFSRSLMSDSETPWTAAHQASLSITNSQSLLKLMSIELVMPSNHLILCHPLLSSSVFPSIRVFSNQSVLRIRWPKYWSFSFNISPSDN